MTHFCGPGNTQRILEKNGVQPHVFLDHAMAEGDVFVMKRLMRLRGSQHLRDLCAETEFNRAQLIQPFFRG